jgi:hypothetical protein
MGKGRFLLQLFFPAGQKRFFIKIGGGYFVQKYRSASTIGRIPDIHADIAAFQKFVVTGFGILEKAGHDTNIAGLIAKFQQLSFL